MATRDVAAPPRKPSRFKRALPYVAPIGIPILIIVVAAMLEPSGSYSIGKFAGFVQSWLVRVQSCKTPTAIVGDMIPDILFAYDSEVPINLPPEKLQQREAELAIKRTEYEYSEDGPFPGYPPSLKNWTQVCCREDFGFTDLWSFKTEQVISLLESNNRPWKQCEQLQDYLGFFAGSEWFTKPHVADTWNTDEEFGRQRLAGVNPVIIRQIKEIPSNFVVDKEKVNSWIKTTTIDELLSQGKVYLEAYDILDNLTVEADTLLAAPYILHYSDEKGVFRPLAIQLFPDPNKVSLGTFYPDEGDDWMFAKIVAQNALAIHHQVITHLLKTHLYSEVFAIATHRQLHPNHPIFVVLHHHFDRTLYINHEAAEFLVPTIIKFTASTSITGTVQLGAREWAKADFRDLHLKNNLKARGVDDARVLPNYDYRDFGIPIWDAFHRYAKSLVKAYYSCNEDLLKDQELQNWAREISEGGKFKGFPKKIETIDELADILTTIIWTASAQHAAVNFIQYDMLAYVPNMPLAIELTKWPKTRKEIHFKMIEQMLPNCERSWNQVNSVRVLSKLPTWPWQYVNWPVKWKNSGAQQARTRLIEEFQIIISDFQGKNRDRPENLKYFVLSPDRIPLSVGI